MNFSSFLSKFSYFLSKCHLNDRPFFRCYAEMTGFKMIPSDTILEKKMPRPPSLLSIDENRRSLADCILELFKKQWDALYFETDIRLKVLS